MNLPCKLPEPCPICGKAVNLHAITEWSATEVVTIEYECETEPEFDYENEEESDNWCEWFEDHHRMPYVDWMPYENRALDWLNKNFSYGGNQLIPKAGAS